MLAAGTTKKVVLLLLFISAAFAKANAQQPDSVYNRKQTIVVGDNEFKVWNNWLSIGIGRSVVLSPSHAKTFIAADYTFHINDEYFRTGVLLAGKKLGSYSHYHLHLAYGKRRERIKYNLAAFAGPSFIIGYNLKGNETTNSLRQYVGFLVVAQLVYKLNYDFGVGVSPFFDINKAFTTIGIRADIYLSGAYKGKVRKR
jgi:hypothetical protein